LVSCDLVALPTTVTAAALTIINNAPMITCPGNQTIHWDTDVVSEYAVATDPDNCETLTFSVENGPGSIDPVSGLYTWNPLGSEVGEHVVTLRVTDKCFAWMECQFTICVYNIPPEVTNDSSWFYAVWGIQLAGTAEATDPDGGPNSLTYSILSFDGPTWFGGGIQMNPSTGEWTWDIGDHPDYLGDFDLCFIASDGANIDYPDCSPENADTGCVHIHVVGFAISIEKVHNQIQGQNTEVSIYLDSAYMPDVFLADLIGGFDFLIAYDASALTALSAEPGALIDNDKFEYFTYRFGPWGNCGNGCPSGMMRIVGMRETNDGILNTYHITGPGELVKLHFYVTNDRTFGCMYAPIRFYWIDCGDNTLSDESGNWLHLGIRVFDFEGNEITDPLIYGYSGPEYACFDTVYSSQDSTFKNAPIGSIYFRNGGVDIICPDSIDDRGDINLNGVSNEIADAVVFTNYFIYGLAAFTINVQGQIAATEINGDGYVLTVADLVYLVRVVVGDANPLPKVSPDAYASFSAQGSTVSVEANIDLGAAAFVFEGQVVPTLGANAEQMDLVYAYDGEFTRALVYSLTENTSFGSGQVLNVSGHGTLISVEAAAFLGAPIRNEFNVLPTDFELSQNYPNPFNPQTSIDLDLPVASQWTISVFNVAGQRVAEFSGFSEAGTVTVNWDASGMSSGMYFYKAVAGDYAATKKMVLLK
jgi:hypothetical protein